MTKLKETKLDDQIEIILKFVGPRGKFVQGIVLQVVKCEMMNGFNTFDHHPFLIHLLMLIMKWLVFSIYSRSLEYLVFSVYLIKFGAEYEPSIITTVFESIVI